MRHLFTLLTRGLLRLLVRALFRVQVHGLEHCHNTGERVLIVANHPSLLDGLMLYLFLPMRPAFAVNSDTAGKPRLRWLLACVEHYELDTLNPVSLKTLTRVVRDGRPLVIFPEGRVTDTGILMKIYDGPGLVADRADCTILPVAIDGLQYSPAGRLAGRVRRSWLPATTIRVLAPRRLELDPTLKGASRREAATAALEKLMQEVAFAATFERGSLFSALVRAARRHGARRPILEDATGASLSYRDMITRSFVLGAMIARMTRPGDRVGIMLPSTAGAVVTLFACLARGREAAMLNFTAGARGLVTAVETASIRLVFTSRAFVEAGELEDEAAALADNTELVYLEDVRSRVKLPTKLGGLLAASAPLLAHRLFSAGRTPDSPAVILFTSGSEGIPKGVVLSHDNLLANFAQVNTLIDIDTRDRVLNVLPIFHAFGLLGGLLLPLLKGTPTFQYPSPLHYRIIPELCYKLGVTCLFGTTTFLRGYGRVAHPYDFHRMRFVISGAEKMTDDVRELWFERFGIRIFEGYGATEASPVLAVNYPLACRHGTVGRLVAGMEHYLEPVPGIHEGGELVVRGPNVMLGYLFHGSDGAIIPPWTEARGVGWYATGDIVSVDADGFVSIAGRAKRFAKIGGEMISLAAVEDLAISRWPDGQHAAVAVSDARKGEQIVLVTNVAECDRAALIEAARSAGASELTIPRRVIHVDALPLLGSGKVDYPGLRNTVAAA
ncbi:MAG: AMP-binding protein [Gammaproteobacteria bacterium]